MMRLIETETVGFGEDGFATHKACGEMLALELTISRCEYYIVKRDGATECVGDGGDDKDWDDEVYCAACEVPVVLEWERGEGG